MSVYTSIRLLIEELDTSLFASAEPPDPFRTVQSMRRVMPEIRRYGKNMNPEDWDRLQPYIESDEEILISEDAYHGARRSWEYAKSRLHDKKGVGAFYSGLARAFDDLLVYSLSWSEGCEVCQGTLYYYVLSDRGTETLVTSCGTCGGLFDARSGSRILFSEDSSIRRAVKADLERF
ncbi:hypothetical protein CDO73_10955 [Saccharibacillus sp. O23]|uniref:hypothetical protein n=1 Tax=Saccharibacillus sp. O23 TaxID=2009338 RepID=UPI000B4E3F30|nr:hypothetical protein [Saccharibacillus sp. O23]OWR30427.1 hypothetical protein CDO73_10955 [Saccharibacillus sp. O23]